MNSTKRRKKKKKTKRKYKKFFSKGTIHRYVYFVFEYSMCKWIKIRKQKILCVWCAPKRKQKNWNSYDQQSKFFESAINFIIHVRILCALHLTWTTIYTRKKNEIFFIIVQRIFDVSYDFLFLSLCYFLSFFFSLSHYVLCGNGFSNFRSLFYFISRNCFFFFFSFIRLLKTVNTTANETERKKKEKQKWNKKDNLKWQISF